MLRKSQLDITIKILLLGVLFVGGAYFAKPFLVPLVFGIVLAMLFRPVSRWLESKGLNRSLSALTCACIIVLAFAALGALLSWQISEIASEAGNIEQKVNTWMDQVQHFIYEKFGLNYQKQKEMMEGQESSLGSQITSIVEGLMGTVVDFILAVVYTFLILLYRKHLKQFIISLVPEGQKAKAESIISESNKVSFQYLSGLSKMIVILWIMYGIGFWVIGVKNPFFFAILCGLLEIIPFVGNLTGSLLTILGTFVQGGGTEVVIWIVLVYGTVQFIQTYLLEPLVVGAQVNLNPLFTIMVLVLGELIWGLAGMILAIPIAGIAKIVCDHIEPLKPYGKLLGNGGKKQETGLIDKIKGWFNKD